MVPRLSTAVHPESEGQSERINAVMEQFLQAYVSYEQDDWVTLLSLAKFAHDNQVSETTGVSPFFSNHGFNPRFTIRKGDNPASTAENSAHGLTQELQNLHQELKAEIRQAQFIKGDMANAHQIPTPNYQVGDHV